MARPWAAWCCGGGAPGAHVNLFMSAAERPMLSSLTCSTLCNAACSCICGLEVPCHAGCRASPLLMYQKEQYAVVTCHFPCWFGTFTDIICMAFQARSAAHRQQRPEPASRRGCSSQLISRSPPLSRSPQTVCRSCPAAAGGDGGDAAAAAGGRLCRAGAERHHRLPAQRHGWPAVQVGSSAPSQCVQI